MYRWTVRGETRIPSFTSSSEAIRSSPHVQIAAAIAAINRWRLAGTRGRPCGLDSIARTVRLPFDAIESAFPASRRGAAGASQSNGIARRASASRVRCQLASAGSCARRTTTAACEGTDSRQRVACAAPTSTAANRPTSPRTQTIVRTSRRGGDAAIRGCCRGCAFARPARTLLEPAPGPNIHANSVRARLSADLPRRPTELLHNLLHAPGLWRLTRGIISNFFDST
jgi:hypothetical protein